MPTCGRIEADFRLKAVAEGWEKRTVHIKFLLILSVMGLRSNASGEANTADLVSDWEKGTGLVMGNKGKLWAIWKSSDFGNEIGDR